MSGWKQLGALFGLVFIRHDLFGKDKLQGVLYINNEDQTLWIRIIESSS